MVSGVALSQHYLDAQGYFILGRQRINSLSDTLSPIRRTFSLSQEIHFLAK